MPKNFFKSEEQRSFYKASLKWTEHRDGKKIYTPKYFFFGIFKSFFLVKIDSKTLKTQVFRD